MTRLLPVKCTCAICGREDEYNVMLSTNSFGPMDLDTRPPMMRRYTLQYEIQMCESCYYVNSDIGEVPADFRADILKSPKYLAVAENPEIEKTAKAFILAGLIYKDQKKYRSAGISFLKAAWVFDDCNRTDMAISARRESYKCLSEEIKKTKNTDLEVMTVDILRRTGDFSGASKIAHGLMERGVDGLRAGILMLELRLCLRGDVACHNISEID